MRAEHTRAACLSGEGGHIKGVGHKDTSHQNEFWQGLADRTETTKRQRPPRSKARVTSSHVEEE